MHVIRMGADGMVHLIPASSWHFEGSHDPDSWTVRVTAYGLSTSTTWNLPASAVPQRPRLVALLRVHRRSPHFHLHPADYPKIVFEAAGKVSWSETVRKGPYPLHERGEGLCRALNLLPRSGGEGGSEGES